VEHFTDTALQMLLKDFRTYAPHQAHLLASRLASWVAAAFTDWRLMPASIRPKVRCTCSTHTALRRTGHAAGCIMLCLGSVYCAPLCCAKLCVGY
jgi:hypothetical protein